jgi:hypothetical protein
MVVRCPRCGNAVAWEDNPFRPFCSERCKLIDLGKWASEEYRIAGETASRRQIDDAGETLPTSEVNVSHSKEADL